MQLRHEAALLALSPLVPPLGTPIKSVNQRYTWRTEKCCRIAPQYDVCALLFLSEGLMSEFI